MMQNDDYMLIQVKGIPWFYQGICGMDGWTLYFKVFKENHDSMSHKNMVLFRNVLDIFLF